jgi:predicted transposase YbfD/YdcC
MEAIDKIVLTMKNVPDFRKAKGQRYKLHNLLTISILAISAGADTFEDFAAFCESKQLFLQNQGLLVGDRLPSHDLFRWIFMRLDSAAFASLLSAWLEEALAKAKCLPQKDASPLPLRQIHIDGKSLRATRTTEHTRTALQVVSAYVSEQEFCVGQLLIDGKSCEKTAIPQLVDLLELKDSHVTIDAAGTMKQVAAKIKAKGGEYTLALKKNNKLLYQEVEDFFRVFDATQLVSLPFTTEENKHGRQEQRVCQVISDLQYFPDAEGWVGIRTLARVQSSQIRGGKVVTEKRYYISSLLPHAETLAGAIRKHWTVENNLHWSLDVAFNEDKATLKDKNAANALSAMRRFALAIVKNAKISKNSVKTHRLMAAWDDSFLDKLFRMLS